MADIFISYSNKDRELTKKLAGALEDAGYSIWWDTKILGGRAFRKAIEEEINNAQCVIVVWSQHSVYSDFVVDEAGEAKKQGKPLLPVSFDGSEGAIGFRGYHVINLNKWDKTGDADVFRQLTSSLEAAVGKVPVTRKTKAEAEAEAQRKAEEGKVRKAELAAKRKEAAEKKKAEAGDFDDQTRTGSSLRRVLFGGSVCVALAGLGFYLYGIKDPPLSAQGPFVLHIHSMSSYSAAESAYAEFRRIYPELSRGLSAHYQKINHPEHGTMYRVTLGTFSEIEDADKKCLQFINKGLDYCTPVPKFF